MDTQTTLDYFVQRFHLNLDEPLPIKILKASRPTMAKCLEDLEFRSGAEIGVAAGEHSEILLKAMPNTTLYSIDPWIKGARWPEEWKQAAHDRLSHYPNCIIRQQYSVEAARRFKDGSLDFVYIDANHNFKYIAEDLCAWRPKVKAGGILFGHDFIRHVNCQVMDVVPAFAAAYDLKPWFVLGMGNRADPPPGRPKMDGPYYEFPPSWMFIL